jgi:polyhydroxyalkanoate synthesis regulator phasin
MNYTDDDIEQLVLQARGSNYKLERLIKEYQNDNIKKELHINSLESEVKLLREKVKDLEGKK